MKKQHLAYLACPSCKSSLSLRGIDNGIDDIKDGTLRCIGCLTEYPITKGVPRFVSLHHYSDSFGFEWTRHSRTQYDSFSKANISRLRFHLQTGWPAKMIGETILEAGSGSGRFTEQAAETQAMILSIDSSIAVDANYAANGGRANVLIVQGDLRQMPFRYSSADRLFCFGVLQHTPNPQVVFNELLKYLSPGGEVAIDVYRKIPGLKSVLFTKYLARRVTTHMPYETLYFYCERYVGAMWRPTAALNRIHRGLSWLLLVADYRGRYQLDDSTLKEWAVLDTFDMLSPAYDEPQTVTTVKKWFKTAGMQNVEIRFDFSRIEARGTKAPIPSGR